LQKSEHHRWVVDEIKVQAPGTARDVSNLASFALGLACGVRLGWGGLPVARPMRGDIDDLLSAAWIGVGRSLQACRATQVDRQSIT
jgi:hypothetical protein